jgi:hypothetical protein
MFSHFQLILTFSEIWIIEVKRNSCTKIAADILEFYSPIFIIFLPVKFVKKFINSCDKF